MPATTPSGPDADAPGLIRAIIAQLAEELPGQVPLPSFIPPNSRHGYWQRPFGEALSRHEALTGSRVYLPDQRFRQFFQAGRILADDLRAAYAQYPTLRADEILLEIDRQPLRRGDIFTLALVHGLEPLSAPQLTWLIEAGAVLEQFQPDVPTQARHRFMTVTKQQASDDRLVDPSQDIGALWQACLASLRIEHPSPDMVEYPCDPDGDRHTHLLDQAGRLLEDLWQSLGTRHTLRTLLQTLTGQDILDTVRHQFACLAAAHPGEGVAAWFNAGEGLHPDGCEDPAALDPAETVHQELLRLGLPVGQWAAYLQHLTLELPGWAGWQPDQSADPLMPATLMDFLAIRLLLDRQAFTRLCTDIWPIAPALPALRAYLDHNRAEFLVRHTLHRQVLPESLAHRARQEGGCDWVTLAHLIDAWLHGKAAEQAGRYSSHRDGWRLFRLTQHLGLTAGEVESLAPGTAVDLLDTLDSLTPDIRGGVWLGAFEQCYRDALLNALARNRERWPSRDGRPAAQIICCMDECEESLRRHLEAINPAIETLGAAGLFDIAMRGDNLDEDIPRPQSPAGAILHHLAMFLRGRAVPASPPTRPDHHCTDAGQADQVQKLLFDTGLTDGFGSLVILMGHGSGSENCGACKGRHGGLNARMYAAMANRSEVRCILSQRGLSIPDDTWFVAAEHDTRTETIRWHASDTLPSRFRPWFNLLNNDLKQATVRVAHERCRGYVKAPHQLSPGQVLRHIRRREPERRHATHAAIIIGRRRISQGLLLDRRLFLMSYDASRDEAGARLEGMLGTVGPVLVTLNLTCHFSATQTEIHEPMRLLMVVEHTPDTLTGILARQPPLAELVGNAWMQLVSLDPDSGDTALYRPGVGFEPWRDTARALAEAPQLAD